MTFATERFGWLQTGLGDDPSGVDGLAQGGVVTLVLVGVGLGEGRHRLIDDVDAAEVAAMATGSPERAWARASVHPQTWAYLISWRADISSTTAEPFPSHSCRCRSRGGPVEAVAGEPAEEDVARRLHQALTFDDALAVVVVQAPAEDRLEHRRLRFLQLEEERIAVVVADHQRDPRPRPHAADTDDLAGSVDVAEALEQVAPVAGQRAPVRAEDGPDGLAEVSARSAGRRSSIGTMSGGSAMIRGSPSTKWVSLSNARMLSLARALATVRSNCFSSPRWRRRPTPTAWCSRRGGRTRCRACPSGRTAPSPPGSCDRRSG